MKNIISIIFLLFCISAASPVQANFDTKELDKMSDQIKKVSRNISRGQFNGEDLTAWTKLTIKIKSSGSLCVANSEAAVLELKTKMDGLGEKVDGEDKAVTKQRKEYQKQKDELDKTVAKCNLYIASSEETSKLISEAEKSYFKQKYLARTPHMIELVMNYLENPVALLRDSGEFIFKRSGINEIDVSDIAASIIVVMLSLFVGIFIRRKLLRIEARRQWKDEFSSRFGRAWLTTTACAMPYLLTSMAAAISSVLITAEAAERPFVTEFFIALLVFFVAITTIRLLLSPSPPAERYTAFSPHIAESLAIRFRVLAVIALVGYLAFFTVFSESIIESNLLLMRNIYSLFLVINLVWTLQVIIKSPKLPKLRYMAMLVIVAVVLSLIAEWMGYRNIAFASRRVVLITFIAFLFFVGISKLFSDLFDAIDGGGYAWSRRLRDSLGVESGQKMPGLIWLRLIMAVIIWGSFLYLFIDSWDYSGGVIEHVKSYIINGFDIGDFRIIPGKIIWAIFIFSAIIIFSSWMRSQLEHKWLSLTAMGQGARDAVVTIIGYIMFMVAALAGLSAAGFDFGNIAIIAGALSVGIGFGLQNIVNNFVSGLILLFERPVRKGDWIEVGGTEGYVKDIQIRSTRIQTFDRSDVIVPNSELISNQVTNWVLSSSSGRAIIPVGVAYGTDTEKVREILLNIADENKDVAKTTMLPKPNVLFREFGDSSLNFELRVFLNNVDSRLSVISDLNFAIDKAFREADIEIPFPQRDLHVKSLPDGVRQDEQKD